jgi:hypothetical protein
MTLEEYRLINLKERIEAVLVYGERVGERLTKKHMVVLYQIDSFYVETYFTLDTRKIVRGACWPFRFKEKRQ